MAINWKEKQTIAVDYQSILMSREIHKITKSFVNNNSLLDGLEVIKINDNTIELSGGVCVIDNVVIHFENTEINIDEDFETPFSENSSRKLVIKYKFLNQVPSNYATVDAINAVDFDPYFMLHIGNIIKEAGVLKVQTVKETSPVLISKAYLEENYGILKTSKQVYVSTTGDDEHGDGSFNSEYKTLERALMDCPPYLSDGVEFRVRLKNGTYNLDNPFKFGGISGDGSIIIDSGDSSTSKNTSQPVVIASNHLEPIVFSFLQINELRIRGIRFVNTNNTNGVHNSIVFNDCSNVNLYYSSIENQGSTNTDSSGIRAKGNTNILVLTLFVDGTTESCVRSDGNSVVSISDVSSNTGKHSRYGMDASEFSIIRYQASASFPPGSVKPFRLRGTGPTIESKSTEIIPGEGKTYKTEANDDVFRLRETHVDVYKPMTINNTTLVTNFNADLLDGLHSNQLVLATTQVIAGNGLTGGGDLSANRTITLGTPSTCSTSTSNNTTATSHTHALTGVVPTTRTVLAGNGLTGGGDLSANRTITLGTPGTITGTSTNSVTTSSHTHALDVSSLGVGPAPLRNLLTGAGNFIVPSGVTKIYAIIMGAGSNGYFQSGNPMGGFSGGVRIVEMDVAPNQSIPFLCGASSGGYTIFGSFDTNGLVGCYGGAGSPGSYSICGGSMVNEYLPPPLLSQSEIEIIRKIKVDMLEIFSGGGGTTRANYTTGGLGFGAGGNGNDTITVPSNIHFGGGPATGYRNMSGGLGAGGGAGGPSGVGAGGNGCIRIFY